MSNKVKVPGGAFYLGDGLTVDPVTKTVSAGGGDVTTPDWNQNDETAPDYVKNRTHYEEDTITVTETLWCGGYISVGLYSNILTPISSELWNVLLTKKAEISSSDGNYVYKENSGYVDHLEYELNNRYSIIVYKKEPYAYIISNYPDTQKEKDVEITYKLAGVAHPLDPKFIPESVKHMYINITTNADGSFSADHTFAEISEHIINGGTASVIFDSLNMALLTFNPGVSTFYVFTEGGYVFLFIGANGSVTVHELNLYDEFVSLYQEITNSGKFLTVGEDGVVAPSDLILRSSTTDSTKRFKITVDDSGTISATEVTA